MRVAATLVHVLVLLAAVNVLVVPSAASYRGRGHEDYEADDTYTEPPPLADPSPGVEVPQVEDENTEQDRHVAEYVLAIGIPALISIASALVLRAICCAKRAAPRAGGGEVALQECANAPAPEAPLAVRDGVLVEQPGGDDGLDAVRTVAVVDVHL